MFDGEEKLFNVSEEPTCGSLPPLPDLTDPPELLCRAFKFPGF